MINLFAVVRFIVQFLLIYLFLMLMGNYMESIQKKITSIYVNKGGDYFETFATQKRVKFKTLNTKNWIVRVHAYDNKVMKNNWGELNLWGVIYLPIALFVSLLLTSSFKKWWHWFVAGIAGLLLLWLYFYACLYYKIIHLFHTIDKTEPDFSGGIFYDLVSSLNLMFIDNLNIYLLYAVIVWFFVAFKKEHFLLNHINEKLN